MTNCRGNAIITALMLVALVASLGTLLQLQQRQAINYSQSYFQQQNAFAASTMVFAWATVQLQAPQLQPQRQLFPEQHIVGGKLTGKIKDAQGSFNVNNLLDKKNISKFTRLILIVAPTTDPEEALQISTQLHQHLQQAPLLGYFATLDELCQYSELGPNLLQQLRPFLSVLPGIQPINVNTAPEPVLGTLGHQLDPGLISEIINAREQNPFQSLTELQHRLHHSLLEDEVTTESRYFLITATLTLDQEPWILYSLLARDGYTVEQPLRFNVKRVWQAWEPS